MTPTPGIDPEDKLTIVPSPSKESKLILPLLDLNYEVVAPSDGVSDGHVHTYEFRYYSPVNPREYVKATSILPFGSTSTLNGIWTIRELSDLMGGSTNFEYFKKEIEDYKNLYHQGKKFAEKYSAPYFTLSDFTTEGLKEMSSWFYHNFYRKQKIGFRLDCKVQLWIPKES